MAASVVVRQEYYAVYMHFSSLVPLFIMNALNRSKIVGSSSPRLCLRSRCASDFRRRSSGIFGSTSSKCMITSSSCVHRNAGARPFFAVISSPTSFAFPGEVGITSVLFATLAPSLRDVKASVHNLYQTYLQKYCQKW